MKIKLLFALAILTGFHGQAQSTTYTNLVCGIGQSASLNVNTGQVATIVSAKNRGGYGQITVTLGTVDFLYQVSDLTGATAIGTVAGPAKITLLAPAASGAQPGYCTIQLTSPAAQLMPSTAVVIPADSGGPVNIILESSVDLVNWTAALPGTYGTSTTNRFFRVRAQRNQ